MYYVVRLNGVYQVIHADINGNYDAVYNLLKKCGVDLLGQFGLEEYAKEWADKYNNQLTEAK